MLLPLNTKSDLIIQDPINLKLLDHKEMFIGKIADWTEKPVPREIYFAFTPLAENHNHRESGLK